MRLIDAERYRKEFLNSRDFEPMKILDFQPTIQAILIPDNATNYDVLKAVFGGISAFRIKDTMEFEKGFELWFSKPYKEVEKCTKVQ